MPWMQLNMLSTTTSVKNKMTSFTKFRNSNSIETCFGSHSLGTIHDSVETSFGSHSEIQEKQNADNYENHILTDDEHKKIHSSVAPIHDEKLNEPELNAVKKYSDQSRLLNKMLYAHDKGSDISSKEHDDNKEITKHLESGLSKHKTKSDVHLYTGLKVSPSRYFKRSGGVIPEHKEVMMPAFTSTSTSVKSAKEFSRPTMHPNDERHGISYPDDDEVKHVLKIHVPKGTNAMSLQKHSFCPAEKEILLGRGHKIEIHHKPERLDSHTYLWNAKLTSHTPHDLDKPVE